GRTLLTPITLAARRGDSGMVEFLRDRGATLSIVTWVYVADEKRIVHALKRDPTLVHIRDELGTPLLHHGVEALRPPIVMLLLDRCAKVDDTDRNAATPLHRAADIRRAPGAVAGEVATVLLDRGADANARNWDGV